MSLLFSPFTMRSVTLPNRIVMSPMCQYSSIDGMANDWHLVHYGSRAVGGVGLVLLEATAIDPDGRITPDDLGIWTDEQAEALARIATFIGEHGSVPGIQLSHAGRKASTASEWKGGGRFLGPEEDGWQVSAPSAIPFNDQSGMPQPMTVDEIRMVIGEFAAAALRAVRAGFRVLELHAAHGYLLHQFLSPLSNRREDEYGGSFENRVRIVLETVEAVRSVIPADTPLWVRISATDWMQGGWDEQQSVWLAAMLRDRGVDVLDVSTGGLVPDARIPAGYGYQLPFASRIKRETEIDVGAVGMMTDGVQAETVLRNGDADLIVVGRELLRCPYFPLHAARDLREEVSWPVQYQRAKPR